MAKHLKLSCNYTLRLTFYLIRACRYSKWASLQAFQLAFNYAFNLADQLASEWAFWRSIHSELLIAISECRTRCAIGDCGIISEKILRKREFVSMLFSKCCTGWLWYRVKLDIFQLVYCREKSRQIACLFRLPLNWYQDLLYFQILAANETELHLMKFRLKVSNVLTTVGYRSAISCSNSPLVGFDPVRLQACTQENSIISAIAKTCPLLRTAVILAWPLQGSNRVILLHFSLKTEYHPSHSQETHERKMKVKRCRYVQAYRSLRPPGDMADQERPRSFMGTFNDAWNSCLQYTLSELKAGRRRKAIEFWGASQEAQLFHLPS